MEPDFPSNSYNKIQKKSETPEKAVEEKPEVTKVIEGEVIRRKKPLGKRLKETFIGGDSGSVWKDVLLDVIIPQAKDMLVDSASQGVERMIYGDVRTARGSRPGRSSNYTPYNRYSANKRPTNEPRTISSRGRETFDFDEVVLPTRPEAEDVIDRMYDILSKYEMVTVADLYSLLGIKPNYTDHKWGWTDLRGLGATRIKGGYLIDIPRPEPID